MRAASQQICTTTVSSRFRSQTALRTTLQITLFPFTNCIAHDVANHFCFRSLTALCMTLTITLFPFTNWFAHDVADCCFVIPFNIHIHNLRTCFWWRVLKFNIVNCFWTRRRSVHRRTVWPIFACASVCFGPSTISRIEWWLYNAILFHTIHLVFFSPTPISRYVFRPLSLGSSAVEPSAEDDAKRAKSESPLYCALCDSLATGKASFDAHVRGVLWHYFYFRLSHWFMYYIYVV